MPLTSSPAGLYEKRYDRTSPKSFDKVEHDKGKHWLYTSAPQRFKDDHERIEGLKQVAFTVGPCLLISGIILLTRDCSATAAFDRAVSCTLLVGDFSLFRVVKVTQQTQCMSFFIVAKPKLPPGQRRESEVRKIW